MFVALWKPSSYIVGFVETVSRSKSFSKLCGIVVLEEGVFCVDNDKHCIWRVDPSSGTASCYAGIEGDAGFRDGSPTTAKFDGPRGLAVSASKSSIYVTDFNSGRIREVQLSDGTVFTLGNRTVTLTKPEGIVDTKDGRLLVSCSDCTIREMRLDSEPASVALAAGTREIRGDRDGHCSVAKFCRPRQMAMGPDGSVYVADLCNNALRKITVNSQVETVCEGFENIDGIAVDDEGNVYVGDRSYKIYMLVPSGLQLVCGSGERNSIDGRGALAALKQPRSLFYDSKSGFLYFTEARAVRRVRLAASSFHDPKLSIDLAKLIDGSDGLPAGNAIFLVKGERISVCATHMCVRSEYFSAMFSSNWKERSKTDGSESTPICIEDATYESFYAVVTFLVTGCFDVQKHSRIIPDILVLADRYLVESLRDFCIGYMARRVSIETAIDYLFLANRFGFRELRDVAIAFVAKHFRTLCHYDRFTGLGSELLAEIMRRIA